MSAIVFLLILIASSSFFAFKVSKILRNIFLGKSVNFEGDTKLRWRELFRVAIGQGKMTKRPIAGFLHILIYVGFVLINIEVIEIVVDGIFGTHRFLSFLGGLLLIFNKINCYCKTL